MGSPFFRAGPGKPNAVSMPKVFISYTTADSDVAQTIAGALAERHITCWRFERGKIAGEPHLTTSQREIGEAEVVLMVISPASLTSDFVFGELLHARGAKKPIIPVYCGLAHDHPGLQKPKWAVPLGFEVAVTWDR